MSQDASSLLAKRFSAGDPIHITAQQIAEFCAAVGENNPLFIDPVAAKAGPYGGIIAPPALVASPTFRRGESSADREDRFRQGGLMAGIDMELETPIRPGDIISTSTEVKETYEKTGRTGTMMFTVIRSTLTNQKDEVVARIDYRMMSRKR
jgi:3-hydroxybutyryl-CoA dehydratase